MSVQDRHDADGRTRAAFESLGLSREFQSLAWEARAKLTWGDRRDDVLAWLIGSGVDRPTAELIVDTCMRERAQALRIKGMRDLLVGGVLLGVAVGGLILVSTIVNALKESMEISGRAIGTLWAMCALAGVVGAIVLFRGLERVVFGAHAEGAVSDVDEWG